MGSPLILATVNQAHCEAALLHTGDQSKPWHLGEGTPVMCPNSELTHLALSTCFLKARTLLSWIIPSTGMEQSKQINAQVEVGVAVNSKDKQKNLKSMIKDINRGGCIQLEH